MINDASCLNRTSIYGVVKVHTVDDVKNAFIFAKEKNLKVSIAGVRHSMGGQSFAKDALVLDMTGFNQMSIDKDNKILTVQSGATWQEVQNLLNPYNLSVKSMQSVDIFTVGGTISVNAHGMDHRVGSISSTIRSLTLMLPNGEVVSLSKTENPQLFKAVVGGYGLFGVILDAKLDVVDNVMYREGRQVINYHEFPQLYQKIINNNQFGLAYAHFSLAPQSFMKDMIVFTYANVSNFNDPLPPLQETSQVKLRRFIINFAKTGPIGQEIKWLSERYLDPLVENCYKSRNQAMAQAEGCLISRTQQMHDPDKYLDNNIQNNTDILQEYFVPQDKFLTFTHGLREILQRNQTNAINISVRIVHKEDIMLNYAPQDMFAFVLYINQKVTDEDNKKMEKVTSELIDFTSKMGGTYYLPYQLYYTKEQLQSAYPNISEFFDLKKQNDPNGLFTNKFYQKFAI